LQRWLTQDPPLYRLVDSPDLLEGPPRLLLWALSSTPPANLLLEELGHLQERWHPTPVLLVLSGSLNLSRSLLLDLPLQGVLEGPDAVAGRVFRVDFDMQDEVLKALRVSRQSTLIVYKGDKEVARSTGETRQDALATQFRKAL
jgi:hypothetical protein